MGAKRATEASFAVGIDLGTTHCAMASVPLTGDEVAPIPTALPQVVRSSELEARPLLPSFLYMPSEVELPKGALALPWDAKRAFAVGVFARDQGARVPARVVSSAKSWLCHPNVDRRAAILPWGSPAEVPKVSPVEAAARYLTHLREVWDAEHPGAPLATQDLVVTVPASFDAVARDLTVEASELAGLAWRLTLLEEPQAALYAWVSGTASWRKQVGVGEIILVCDVGGGTTDLSLIAVGEEGGSLELHRVAVGDHILLGGDNMDLALAYAMKAKIEAKGPTLDDWQLRSLTYACRAAKEALWNDPKLAKAPIVIPGRGSKLVGGAIKTDLDRAELGATLTDGFFPAVAAADRPASARRTGLTALGLPYASDPAVTRHLAEFLGRQELGGATLPPGVEARGRTFLHPTAILFNGGVMKADVLRTRIVDVLNDWLAADGGQPVKVLAGADPDLAVARGAAYYGRVRTGRGVRIRGGTARAYYVGIERAELAVPGIPPRVDAVCIAPFGMEEGTSFELPQELGLVVGEPATFRFFASSTRREDTAGSVVDPAALEELPPIETTLEGEAGKALPVHLGSRVTEVGTLELSAAERASKRRWKLEFDVRGK
ncbi:MAG: Hsp70 family protein [Deltaproteobacteria bacterium]|nr:Hsp70 family protein [Deltaproteobacteria bacterium]